LTPLVRAHSAALAAVLVVALLLDPAQGAARRPAVLYLSIPRLGDLVRVRASTLRQGQTPLVYVPYPWLYTMQSPQPAAHHSPPFPGDAVIVLRKRLCCPLRRYDTQKVLTIISASGRRVEGVLRALRSHYDRRWLVLWHCGPHAGRQECTIVLARLSSGHA
jgi:hypothetical protein